MILTFLSILRFHDLTVNFIGVLVICSGVYYTIVFRLGTIRFFIRLK
jgi:hypothetical protein